MGRSFPTLMAVFSLLSLIILPLSQATTTCKSHTFKGKTFEHCTDLPALAAALHYSFDAGKSTLSMAFTAPPPAGGDGWVAWGLNPKGSGMVGTQAIVAGKFAGTSVAADTVDIQSYHALVKGPISYNVTGVSAEETADGKITIFADWTVPAGESTVNQVWQVGPVVGGKPGKHAFEQPNLSSRMKLSLAGGAAAAAGAPEPASSTEESHAPASEPVKTAPATGAGEALSLSRNFGLGLVALVVYSLF